MKALFSVFLAAAAAVACRTSAESWGTDLPGIVTRLPRAQKEIALTFDACSGRGRGIDREILTVLAAEEAPATVFVSGVWVKGHEADFEDLLKNPLIDIENHGAEHKPLSRTGREAYGIKGTASLEEMRDEVEREARALESATGRRPSCFRSGTAFYDETGVAAVRELGFVPVGFSVLGDCGATWDADRVERALLASAAGDIVILHINHPESGTAEGLRRALPALKARGFTFVRLDRTVCPAGR